MSFLIDPYRFATAALTGIAVQDFTSSMSIQLVNYTTTALTGVTPKGVLIIGTGHDPANGTSETPGQQLMVGFVSNTAGSNRVALFATADNVASTNGARGNDISSALRLANSAASSAPARANGAVISGGISLDYIQSSTFERKAAFLAFGDAGFSARSNDITLGTGAAVSCSTTFTPHVVFYASGCQADVVSVNGRSSLTFGIATNHSGTIVQKCVGLVEPGAAANARPLEAILTNRIGMQINDATGGNDYDLTISNFSSGGFDITPSATTGTDVGSWLAVNMGSRGYKLVDFTTPTSTGAHAITGVGFRPSAAIIVMTNLEATDPSFPVATSDLHSALSISLVGDEQWSASTRNDSGADPTDTASLMKNTALISGSATNCAAIEATLASFDSDGMTLNYSAVQGTGKKGFILFLQ
jgi:hypothetical protein